MDEGRVFRYTVDLDKDLNKTILRDLFVTENQNAHTFRLKIVRRGTPVDLSSASVIGYFNRYKTRETVPLADGRIEGSEAVLTLSPACYAERTMFAVMINISIGDLDLTVFTGEGQMLANRYDKIDNSDGTIPTLDDLLAQINVMKEATADSRAASQEARDAGAQAVADAQAAGNQAVADAQAAGNEAVKIAQGAADEANQAAKDIDAKVAEANVELAGKVGQLSEEIDNDLSTSNLVTEICFDGGTEGLYIDQSGRVFENENYSFTTPFRVRRNSKVVVTCCGYLSNVAIISSYKDGVYTPLVVSRSSVVETYEYVTTKDEDIVVSYRTLNEFSGKIFLLLNDSFEHIENDISALSSFYEVVNDFSDANTYYNGEYVAYNGSVGSQTGWCRTKPFVLEKNASLVVTGRGNGTNVAIISKYDSESGTHTPIVISEDSEVREYTYTADEECEIVVSLSLTSEHHYTYQKLGVVPKVDNLEVKLKEIETAVSIDFTKMLKRMVGIGDSLMSGVIYDSANSKQAACYNSSWLSFLSRYNGADWKCFSAGGLTTKTWLSGHWKTDFEALTEIPDSVFIALGTNDKNVQETIPTGTVNDSIETESFCGMYKKIIDVVHTKCPHAKIFCCSLYGNTDSTEVVYGELIKNISSQYTYCAFVDIANNLKISRKTNDVYAESSHFSTVGYMVVADTIHDILKRDIAKNLNSYKYFGLYNQ